MNDPKQFAETSERSSEVESEYSGQFSDTQLPDDAATRPPSKTVETPKHIGRYQVERILGEGTFGRVYLAHDGELERHVAIKVPHQDRVSTPEDVEAYLNEARILASLDHPGIVPVYDVGRTDDGLCYVVSKFVEGSDLADKIKKDSLAYSDSAHLVAAVADALHFAHTRGLVHRDVKPANILIDASGKPVLADFGLALNDKDFGKGSGWAGTPAYMSPEQARGEGHRVDGRSDIFSLGIVFYELLTRRRPFRADDNADLLEQISSVEARPPRQVDDKIPKELERICLKTMSKRATDRYTAALDLADDLRHFLKKSVQDTTVSQTGSTPTAESLVATDSAVPPTRIVPKGLRSFDEHDADFFLELLPGPRDREGLPDIIRFWKTRIEEPDPDKTFSVGLIYGPSGCGKSSLVKAGLLPPLCEDVIAVYVEATAEETEARLLNGIRKRCPSLPKDLGLKATLAALRRGHGIPVGKKVLIVLDQFEQWLHAKKEETETELVQALRQCEGGRVQCIVMVRDDFWMAVTRFLRELEVRLVEGQNSAAVDLFDLDHAKNVLAAFGRAFGRLPDIIRDTTKEQTAFIEQAVSGLAQEGKVICVRLALFAELMKGKPWTPASLRAAGGTEGVGVTFLEETFSASTAPPEHRYHQKAARAILQSLLPESGTDIKGHMRSYGELLTVSGYTRRVEDFSDLLRILDNELRLITPTDPEGSESESHQASATPGVKFYQLTHDYLVPSLREWLTRKQKETRRGRAELKLEERSTLWNSKPENRHLPSLWEWSSIRTLTQKKKWTEPQRKMMGKARRVHGMRSALVLVALVAVVFGGITIRSATQERRNDAEATRLVEGLLQADTSQVKAIIRNLTDYRQWAKDDLRKALAESPDDSNAKLHAALAMLVDDESVQPFLKERLLAVSSVQFEYVRNLLQDHKSDLIGDYWRIAKDSGQPPARRFQAACALASYDPDNEHWQDEKLARFVAGHLVGVLPSELLPWRNALRPIKAHLTAPLAVIYRDANQDMQVRGFATDTLADYLSDDAEGLFDLLAVANEKQFAPMFGKITAHLEKAIALGNAEVSKTPAKNATEADKEALAIRQANAAVMLLRMDAADNVWPLLKHSPDPRVRSYIIHWLSPRGGDPQMIITRYEQETDVTIKRALLLCLGEFNESRLSQSQRKPLIETLLTVYRSDPDAGLHAAVEWLLRKWRQGETIATMDKELQQSEEQLITDKTNQRQWYVNGQGQTFVILDAGEFQMGSPTSEAGHIATEERLHRRRIGRRFAISTKEVTKAQWREFQKSFKVTSADHENLKTLSRTEDSPMLGINWYEAAWYCNWLSEQEGISEDQWCYQQNEQDEYGAGMSAKKNFLRLRGYRLPTESEWEFACRAEAETARYYGMNEALLPEYAWCRANSDDHSHAVASLKPNDFGLFDMEGNGYEWCSDAYESYPSSSAFLGLIQRAVADAPETTAVLLTDTYVLRGGAFSASPKYLRSAFRSMLQPGFHYFINGFRPSRTYN